MSETCTSALDKYDIKIWDVLTGRKIFENQRMKRTVPFHSRAECCICFEENGIEMGCGHFICSDDLLINAWDQIKHLKDKINCPSCDKFICIDDIFKFGLPDEDEKQFIMAAVSVNSFESEDIQRCPNCYSYCERKNSDDLRILCTLCERKTEKAYEFCWYCLREWKNSDSTKVCGYSNCNNIVLQKLRKCSKKKIKCFLGKKVSVPKLRACPNCFSLVQHKKKCQRITCEKCMKQFCFVCLANNDHGFCKRDTCIPAPRQKYLGNID